MIPFRPSSHSADYTIIGRYPTEKIAQKVATKLRKLLKKMENSDDYFNDWSPDEAWTQRDGKEVYFQVYTAGYLDDVENVMTSEQFEGYEVYEDYQRLKIRAVLPAKLSLEASMVVLDVAQTNLIAWLNKNCPSPHVSEDLQGNKIFEWVYEGNGIYYEGILYVGDGEFHVDDYSNWEVLEEI